MYELLLRQQCLEQVQRSGWCLPRLRALGADLRSDLWMEALTDRLSLLSVLPEGPLIRHFCDLVRFLGAACAASPMRASRAQVLLGILPGLVRGCAARARTLVLAVRREWVICHGELSNAELSRIAAAAAAAVMPGPTIINAPCRLRPPMSCPMTVDEDSHVVEMASRDEGQESKGSVVSSDELLQCLACGTPVLKVDDILSSEYRIMNGPAYLADAAYNICVSVESHEVSYMSGSYDVRHLACSCCAARLGVMYAGAVDAANHFKIGKFLFGQEHLVLLPELPLDLRGHLQDLISNGSAISVEVPSASQEVVTNSAVQAPALVASRQRLIVTIKRYIRCILPPVYVPLAPWTIPSRTVPVRVPQWVFR